MKSTCFSSIPFAFCAEKRLRTLSFARCFRRLFREDCSARTLEVKEAVEGFLMLVGFWIVRGVSELEGAEGSDAEAAFRFFVLWEVLGVFLRECVRF